MKLKSRKLTLNRETLRTLQEQALRRVAGGGSDFGCSAYCDTYMDCSTACLAPTNIHFVCG